MSDKLKRTPKLYKLIRNVTPSECRWLERIFLKDEIVHKFYGNTYGCVSDEGIACSIDGDTPFFELPYRALTEYTPDMHAGDTL